jgi:hypothetical protein
MTVAIAAAMVQKQKKIVAAFQAAGATNHERAVTAEALGVHQGAAFRILCRHGVLREAGERRLFLDQSSWEALGSRRRRTALFILGGVLLAASIAILWGLGK